MSNKIKKFLSSALVPILFLTVSLIATPISGLSTGFLINELLARLARNAFFVLALILPIMAGMGINFGMIMGAMAAQIGLVFAINWEMTGITGILVAIFISVPISVLLGYFGGVVLNRAKGREMITSMILGLFIAGIYQLFLLYICGLIIPIKNPMVLLSRGYGVRSTLVLPMAGAIDNLWKIRIIAFDRFVTIPISTFLVIAVLCIFTVWFRKTKFGQNIRAVGQDMEISEMAGIDVNKNRISAIIISTVLACLGQIVFLQNLGTLNTYNGADQAALFAAAAILVGGATVSKASIVNAIIGTALFHLMFLVMKDAGTKITGQAMIGEYLRMFICYGIISITLVIHSWKRQKDKELDRKAQRMKAE